MNGQCSSAVGFHLLSEMPLFWIFEDTVSFQTHNKKNASEEQTSPIRTTFLSFSDFPKLFAEIFMHMHKLFKA